MRGHGLAGLYKGQVPTLWRESIGYGVYFLTYEKLVQRDMRLNNYRRQDVSSAKAVLYGATAGYVLWAFIYPIDVVKSRIQTDGFSSADGRKYASTLDCLKKVWKAEGANGFLRGLGPTVIRYVARSWFPLEDRDLCVPLQFAVCKRRDVPRVRACQSRAQQLVTRAYHLFDVRLPSPLLAMSSIEHRPFFPSIYLLVAVLSEATLVMSARGHKQRMLVPRNRSHSSVCYGR